MKHLLIYIKNKKNYKKINFKKKKKMILKKRGLLIDLENIQIPNVTNFEETLKTTLKVPLSIITFEDMAKEKESDMREMKSKSERMYKRASHMLYAMERWKKREEILKELDKGNNIFIINYCFKEIAENVCDDLDIEWAKTHYTINICIKSKIIKLMLLLMIFHLILLIY